MRPDFLGLQAFLSIAERGSFRAAAMHLNLSQTALSHRIRKLEDGLGVRLFERTTREVTLSAAGVELLPQVRDALGGLTQSLSDLRLRAEAGSKVVRIGCLPTLTLGIMPGVVAAFRKLHPAVAVQIADRSASEITEGVAGGALDFGITLQMGERWDFATRFLAVDPYMLACPEGHAFASRDAVEWRELAGHPLIRIGRETGNRAIIDEALGDLGLDLDWRVEVQHLQSALAMTGAGLLAVVPKLAGLFTGMRGIRLVALREPDITRRIAIVSRRGAPLTPVAADLNRLILQAFERAVGQADPAP